MKELSLDDLAGKVFVTKHDKNESQEQPTQRGYWGYRLQIKNFIIRGAVGRQRSDESCEIHMMYTWNTSEIQGHSRGAIFEKNKAAFANQILRGMANYNTSRIAESMGSVYIGIMGEDFKLKKRRVKVPVV